MRLAFEVALCDFRGKAPVVYTARPGGLGQSSIGIDRAKGPAV